MLTTRSLCCSRAVVGPGPLEADKMVIRQLYFYTYITYYSLNGVGHAVPTIMKEEGEASWMGFGEPQACILPVNNLHVAHRMVRVID